MSNISLSQTPSVRAQDWRHLEEVLLAHFYKPDLEAARILFSAVGAHKLHGVPVWPMIVGPPGSLKTELLSSLAGISNVHIVDQLTPQTFISGQIKDPQSTGNVSASLLHRIGESGILVCADFSTILSLNADSRERIFADFRRIYDGQLRKEFGVASDPGKNEWKGRITCAVGVTPAIDEYSSVFQSLGQRFVMIRVPRVGGIEAALCAMNQKNDVAKVDLKEAVLRLIGGLRDIDPELSHDIQVKIAALTEIAVRARSSVKRDNSKTICNVIELESATRLAQQLAQLAKGAALLDGGEVVSEDEYKLVQRVALDCMPPNKCAVLKALIDGRPYTSVRLPGSTKTYAANDLEAVGLMDGHELSSLAVEYLTLAGYGLPPAPTIFRAA